MAGEAVARFRPRDAMAVARTKQWAGREEELVKRETEGEDGGGGQGSGEEHHGDAALCSRSVGFTRGAASYGRRRSSGCALSDAWCPSVVQGRWLARNNLEGSGGWARTRVTAMGEQERAQATKSSSTSHSTGRGSAGSAIGVMGHRDGAVRLRLVPTATDDGTRKSDGKEGSGHGHEGR